MACKAAIRAWQAREAANRAAEFEIDSYEYSYTIAVTRPFRPRTMKTLMKSASATGLPTFPKHDVRLLGAWRTDKRRTFAEWNWRKGISPKKRSRLKSLFGNLEVTYTRTKVISVLRHRNWETSRHYKVLGLDESSVAISVFGELKVKGPSNYWAEGLRMVKEANSKPTIKTIHFDKKNYWVSIGNGKNREFFRKIRRRRRAPVRLHAPARRQTAS
jgi:hypothetical protein